MGGGKTVEVFSEDSEDSESRIFQTVGLQTVRLPDFQTDPLVVRLSDCPIVRSLTVRDSEFSECSELEALGPGKLGELGGFGPFSFPVIPAV